VTIQDIFEGGLTSRLLLWGGETVDEIKQCLAMFLVLDADCLQVIIGNGEEDVEINLQRIVL
jgi:hypothetical protein